MIKCSNLNELWKYVLDLNKEYFSESGLMPIVGNGKIRNPKVMFVFINPTAKNISSDESWHGFRAPFIGTKQVWRIFHKAGLFDDRLINRINDCSVWSVGFAREIYGFLAGRGFYFTNIVKWTGKDSSLPDSEKIKLFLPILEKEIELVCPEYIVAFGLIPFESLAKHKIKLSEYYARVIKNKRLEFFGLRIGAKSFKIVPCYFPVGRGNPAKAVEILKLVGRL